MKNQGFVPHITTAALLNVAASLLSGPQPEQQHRSSCCCTPWSGNRGWAQLVLTPNIIGEMTIDSSLPCLSSTLLSTVYFSSSSKICLYATPASNFNDTMVVCIMLVSTTRRQVYTYPIPVTVNFVQWFINEPLLLEAL